MRAKKKFGARHTYPKRWVPDAAEQRRWRLRAALIGLLTVEDFEFCTAQALTLREVFALARKRAAEAELICEKCGKLIEESAITEAAVTGVETAENPKPFTA